MSEPEPAHCFHCGAQLGFLSLPFRDVPCKKCRRVYSAYQGKRKGLIVLTIRVREPKLVTIE